MGHPERRSWGRYGSLTVALIERPLLLVAGENQRTRDQGQREAGSLSGGLYTVDCCATGRTGNRQGYYEVGWDTFRSFPFPGPRAYPGLPKTFRFPY
jgi:hypothetical protein